MTIHAKPLTQTAYNPDPCFPFSWQCTECPERGAVFATHLGAVADPARKAHNCLTETPEAT